MKRAFSRTKKTPFNERFLAIAISISLNSMDRLACNLDDLRRLVQKLTKRGVRIEFLKEGLIFTGDDLPMANLMLSVMGPSRSSSERSFVSDNARASPGQATCC